MYIPGMKRLYSFWLRWFRNFHHFGTHVSVDPSCDIYPGAAPYLSIGNNVTLAKDVWLNIPCESMSQIQAKVIITIGNGVAIGRRSTISGINRIVIEDKVLMAPGVFITDHCHEFTDPLRPIVDQGVTEAGSVIIEQGCWLGHNCAIIAHKGREIRIGKNTTVGANAVVTKSFPANSVLVGVPARNMKG